MGNVHDGHRKRLKDSYRENGLDTFSDLHVLELILFFSIPRGDVNPLAHELLNRFGTLAGVLEAKEEELLEVDGVGENTAFLLKLLPEISRRYRISRNGDRPLLDTVDRVGAFAVPLFDNLGEERAYLISLDTGLRLIGVDLLSQGEPGGVEMSIRRAVEIAIHRKAANVILTHNHPSGSLQPSREDELATRQLRLSLRVMGIQLVDHLIVAGERYLSLNQSGLVP